MKDDLDCSMMEASEKPVPVLPIHPPLPRPWVITAHDLIAVFILGFACGLAVLLVLMVIE